MTLQFVVIRAESIRHLLYPEMQPEPQDDGRPLLLVGNGSSLLGKGLGMAIDAFPRVVRFNSYRISGFESDVGEKTTVWVRSRRLPTMQPVDEFDTIWIAIPEPLRSPDNIAAALAALGDAAEKATIIPRNVIARNLQTAVYEAEGGREWPSTGLLAIAHAVDSGFDVTIAGFDSWDAEPHHYYGPHDRTGTHHDARREGAYICELVRRRTVKEMR